VGLRGLFRPFRARGLIWVLLPQVNGLGLDTIPMQFHEPQRGEITKPRLTAWV